MAVSGGSLLLVPFFAACLIAQISLASAIQADSSVYSYGVYLGGYLSDLPKDAPFEDVAERAVDFMSASNAYLIKTPNILKCHNLLLSIAKLARGDFCEADAETRDVLDLCYTSLLYKKDEALSPFIIRAFEEHGSRCRSKDIESLKKADAEVPADVMRNLLTIFNGCDSVASQYFGDHDANVYYLFDAVAEAVSKNMDPKTRQLLEESKEPTISESKLIKLYDRLVYQPCVAYNRVVEPAFAALKQDEEFSPPVNRSDDVKALLMRPVICKLLAGGSTMIAFEGVKGKFSKLLGKPVATSMKQVLLRSVHLQNLPIWYER